MHWFRWSNYNNGLESGMKSRTKLKILAVSLAVVLTACGGAEERKAKYMEKGKEYFAEKNYGARSRPSARRSPGRRSLRLVC